MIETSRRSAIERKTIQQLRERQEFKKNNPSLGDQIEFFCKEATYRVANGNCLTDMVHYGTRFIFGVCMAAVAGYVVGHHGFGLDPVMGLLVGGMGVCSYTAMKIFKNNKLRKHVERLKRPAIKEEKI